MGLSDCPQKLDINGCSLSITKGNSVDLPITKTVYSTVTSPGVNEEIWTGAGNSAPHSNPSDIFNGSPSAPLGLPSHINGAADLVSVVTDWVDNTANDPSNGTDQARWWGWLYIPANGTQLQDVNANTGELIRIWHASCCGAPQVIFEGAGVPGAGTFATLDEGWHFLAFELSDDTAFAGVQLQIDNAGNGVFANFSGETSATMPEVSCREEACDYELQAGESTCPPKQVRNSNAAIPQSFTTTQVDSSHLAKALVAGDGNQPNTILSLGQLRADPPWSIAADTATLNQAMDFVRIDAMATYNNAADIAAEQRIAPVLELLKNGNVVAASKTGYQRHVSGHNDSSNTIAWTDESPAAGDTYQLRAQQGGTQNEVSNISLGHFSLEAVEKITVLESVA